MDFKTVQVIMIYTETFYTTDACRYNCEIGAVAKHCGCLPYFEPNDMMVKVIHIKKKVYYLKILINGHQK